LIEQLTGHALQIGEGSLYPSLHRLEERGWDCPDGSDEVTGCGIPAATCADGMEIPADFLCDEFGDCNDNSDEITGCGLDAFVCDDGYHIDASWECDTTPDCPDSSDEANC
jgi:hypothetical protein